MRIRKWEDLPENLKNDAVKKYYDVLRRKRFSLFFKRAFDVSVSFLMLIFLLPTFLILAFLIKVDSKGPVFYRQQRITQYGKPFGIYKFRTMVNNADRIGTQVTVNNDKRITKVGKFLRKTRLDEIPQLFNILAGTMTFVGTRPEVKKYVDRYNDEMKATLLLPAGVTSNASIYFKDEAELLTDAQDAEKTYIEEVLPIKMYYNLKSIESFGFFKDLGVLIKTVLAVLGKNYKGDYDGKGAER